MNLNPPIPRLERLRPGGLGGPGRPATEPDDPKRPLDRTTANRTPVKSRTGAVRRERHQADYVILVVVVALTAIGILMVYSSSALKGYLSHDADTFATVGPQIQWAILGFVALAAMMRVDYRYLRLVSVPMYVVAIVLLVLVFVPSLNIEVGGSARWLKLPMLPAVHPAEFAKLALVVYLAHWFAKRGKRVHGFWGGTVPFLVIVLPVIGLVFKEPDLGTTMVITLTVFTMFFVAGANLIHLAVMVSGAALAMLMVGLRGYQLSRIRVWQDPWLDRLGDGFHTVQGLLALGVGGLFGTGLGESKVFVPNAFNDFIFAEVGQEFGMIGAIVVITLFLLLAYSGVRIAWRRRIRSGRCSRPASPPGSVCRRSSTSAWSWRCCRSPGSRCRSSAPAGHPSSSALRRSGFSSRSRARPSKRGRGTTMRLLIAAGGTGGHVPAGAAVTAG